MALIGLDFGEQAADEFRKACSAARASLESDPKRIKPNPRDGYRNLTIPGYAASLLYDVDDVASVVHVLSIEG